MSERVLSALNDAHELKYSVSQVQQWLQDISATRGFNGLNDGFDNTEIYAKRFYTLTKQLQQ